MQVNMLYVSGSFILEIHSFSANHKKLFIDIFQANFYRVFPEQS